MGLPQPSEDSTCLVTGTSSGIGKEIARELAGRGHGVTLVARRESLLQELAKQIRSTHGVRVEVLATDLTDADARVGLVDAVRALGLNVEVLVNNAGSTTTGPVYDADRERELDMMRTDVEAVADLCTLFLRPMVERGQGAILNVASMAAFQPLPGQAGYGASKAFVLSYSRALRGELQGKGVTVTALCPGPVRTGFAEAAGFSAQNAENSMPQFMWVSAGDVARAAVDGLARGRSLVIPGLPNRVGVWLAQMAPRDLLVPFLAKRHPALKRRQV